MTTYLIWTRAVRTSGNNSYFSLVFKTDFQHSEALNDHFCMVWLVISPYYRNTLHSRFYLRQFYSHACVSTRETWTHANQPNAYWLGGDLNAWKPTKYILSSVWIVSSFYASPIKPGEELPRHSFYQFDEIYEIQSNHYAFSFLLPKYSLYKELFCPRETDRDLVYFLYAEMRC